MDLHQVGIGNRLPEDDRFVVDGPDGVTGAVEEGLQQLAARVAGEDEAGVHEYVPRPGLVQQLVA